VRVTVRYFAAHRDIAGAAEECAELPDGATVSALLAELQRLHPGLGDLRAETLVSVNGGVGAEGTVLRDGDVVSVLPPLSGG
jgi:MoaD family protein